MQKDAAVKPAQLRRKASYGMKLTESQFGFLLAMPALLVFMIVIMYPFLNSLYMTSLMRTLIGWAKLKRPCWLLLSPRRGSRCHGSWRSCLADCKEYRKSRLRRLVSTGLATGACCGMWCCRIKAIMALVLLLGTIGSLQHFDLPWVMTQGGPAKSTSVLSIAVYRSAFQEFKLGNAAAIGAVWVAILSIYGYFYLRSLSKEAQQLFHQGDLGLCRIQLLEIPLSRKTGER
jgi:hypothetical protein